jgi:16S rRNA processing protein RimM
LPAKPDRVCLGVIAGAHGVRGELRVESYTADPADIASYGPLTDETGRRRLTLTIVGAVRGQLIARIEGVDDRDAAEALRGLRLHVERSVLPEPAAEEFYHSDLVGLATERSDGTRFGVIRALHDFGAGDVVEIERPNGERVMLPFTKAIVPVIDLAAGRVLVEPPVETEARPERSARSEAGDGRERRP